MLTTKVPTSPNNRAHWLVHQLGELNKSLDASARQSKFEEMATSAFAFYRGSNWLYWSDFASDSRLNLFGKEGTWTWLQGDMHACNFGTFSNNQGQLVYDINDFDEALVADFQLDIWRLAISVLLLLRENRQHTTEDDGLFSQKGEEKILQSLVFGYLDVIEKVGEGSFDPSFAQDIEETSGRIKKLLLRVEEKKTRKKMLDKWTILVDGERILKREEDFKKRVKLAEVDPATSKALEAGMADYGKTLRDGLGWNISSLRVKSVRKRLLAGTGSLGLPRYYILVEGPSAGEERILDVKWQSAPAGFSHISSSLQERNAALYQNHAERVVVATRGMGVLVDDFLGWTVLPEGAFLVRERSPFKNSLDTTKLVTSRRFEKVAAQWGAILACAHTRAEKSLASSSFSKEVLQSIANKREEFLDLVCEVAFAYTEQVEADYTTHCQNMPNL